MIWVFGQLHDHQKSDFFGKINEFQVKWIKPLKYDVKTLETTFLKFWPPPLASRGSKSSKIGKKHAFSTKSISGGRTVDIPPFFYFIFWKRNISACHSAKKIMRYPWWKIFYRTFFQKMKKIDTLFFQYLSVLTTKFLCLPPIF